MLQLWMVNIAAGTDEGIKPHNAPHMPLLTFCLFILGPHTHSIISRRADSFAAWGFLLKLNPINDCPHYCGHLLHFLNPQSFPSYLRHAPLRTTDGRRNCLPRVIKKRPHHSPSQPSGEQQQHLSLSLPRSPTFSQS